MTPREKRAIKAMKLWIRMNTEDYVAFEMECKGNFRYNNTLYTIVRFRKNPFDPWLLGVTDALFGYDDWFKIYPVITYSRFEPYKKDEAIDDAQHLVRISLLEREYSLYHEDEYYADFVDC